MGSPVLQVKQTLNRNC